MVAASKGRKPPVPRPYVSRVRGDAAVETRHRVLAAARELFLSQGYARTTMASVAAEAGVAVDTVYASVGRKPQLLRLVLETAISGGDEVVPAERRDYVREMQAEPDAFVKLRLYASAIASIMQRLAPVVRVCVEAGPSEPEVAQMWRAISERRAANMRRLVAELAETGSLRPGLTVEDAGDALWATNSPEMYELLVGQRGWSLEHYKTFLADTWERLLLQPPDQSTAAKGSRSSR